ncbi:nitronate monooxygenase [Marispirochaeta sp.]|jgi:nitronate monooxygenase|uniref:NAD(P)H-dependent flavin oxidoreductase n=1 Tax=Marispirochaeta sp. TaxID=2038653 RepID=UPI0029C8E53F|nr:nitronate monooxygenase [Marispirochaeta sp.]
MQNMCFDTAFSSLKKLVADLSGSLPVKGIYQKLNQMSLPRFDWPSFRIGNLNARIPVVQGGMGVGISLSGLASAAANAGGIGIIAANAIGMLEPDYFKDGRAANIRVLRREIRTAREKSNGIIGVNIMVAVNDFHELLDVAIEEKVDLVFMGAGLPIKNIPVERMREAGVKAVPVISSARAAEMIFKMWKKIYNDVPDALVFEGPKAGGHLGFSEEQIDDPAFQLESIVPQVVEAVRPYEAEFQRNIPVIAGGGIFTGEDIYKALELGASAVQMGTRFVATNECDADAAFKEAYVQCSTEDIGLIQSPVGMPGRAIRNKFITDSEEGKRPPFRCAWQCLASCKAEKAKYCISIALNNARRGKLSQGFVFAGSNAYRVEKIMSVVSLVGELAEGFRQTARNKAASRIEIIIAEIQELRNQYDGMRVHIQDFQTAVIERLSKTLPLLHA